MKKCYFHFIIAHCKYESWNLWVAKEASDNGYGYIIE